MASYPVLRGTISSRILGDLCILLLLNLVVLLAGELLI